MILLNFFFPPRFSPLELLSPHQRLATARAALTNFVHEISEFEAMLVAATEMCSEAAVALSSVRRWATCCFFFGCSRVRPTFV